MLQVFKASAGSGKTFRLVLEYLKLILVKPVNYRHILAVTFTNKATAEMKERILDQLSRLAGGKKSPYMENLLQETELSENQIRYQARIALEKLLFDFDRFSVSTIDRFTQRILKAFNREIGINSGYQLETDSELLVSEAVDRMISKIDKKPELQKWLESFIEEKIRNNKSFTIEKDIKSLGEELFKEKLQNNLMSLTGFFENKKNSRDYLALLFAIVSSFDNALRKRAGEIVDIYNREGYQQEDFSYGASGIAGFLGKMANGSWNENIGSRVAGAAESAENWVTRKNKRYNEILSLVEKELKPRLQLLLDFIGEKSREYFTARVIVSEWFTTAVLIDLNEELTSLGREKEVLPLASSNLLLKAVIDGSDTPFIYEKAGNTWYHFMLDEFQDTSEMQWENFRPLISNSLSDNHANLVVGDVKQSIYRWRNSNWNILNQQIYSDLQNFSIQRFNLQSNFRSGKNIVGFNNGFFPLFCQLMANFPKLTPDYQQQLKNIYGDVAQRPENGNEPEGYVCIEQLDNSENNFAESSLHRLVQQVKTLLDKGFKAGDIAILVRKKDEGARIVRYFLEVESLPENQAYPLRILSGESLFLKTSAAVIFIINLLQYFTDRQNLLNQAVLLHLYKNYIEPSTTAKEGGTIPSQSPDGWVPYKGMEQEFQTLLGPSLVTLEQKWLNSGMDEMIIRISAVFRLFEIPSELPYIQTLIDRAAEIKKSGINDISGFLQWWDERGKEVSVDINEGVDAIRLMTIHKAKGLEFKAVLIPFLDWKMVEPGKRNILWCTPSVPPFNKAPLVPVNFSDKLSRTIFSAEYNQELFNRLVDNLNLVYVAFTRAVSVLWINVPYGNNSDSIGNFLNQTTSELTALPGFEDSWNERERIFSCGSIPVVLKNKEMNAENSPAGWIFSDFSEKLQLRTGSDDFLQLTDAGTTRKNRGKILHSILSDIKTSSDIEPACRKALASGILLPEESASVMTRLREMVEHPLAKDWFSGEWVIYTETDLLSGELTLRPDRMMIRNDMAIVVDYKSGDLKQESHVSQVEQYARILRETGISRVKGYLWYIQRNELVEI